MSQFTKRALEDSLKHLLLQKPLNKITINDIAEDCGINRMTFYYHFKDIYDLVEWACLEDAQRALDGKKSYETWQQGFVQIFRAVQENKPFVMNVYRCVSREQVERYLTPLTDNLLMGVINELSANMVVREEDKAFIARCTPMPLWASCWTGLKTTCAPTPKSWWKNSPWSSTTMFRGL